MKEKILEGAHNLFVQFGVRSVSMDDVANRLSVSKKTLYQHFESKDALVSEAVKLHMAGEMEHFNSIAISSQDAIDELINITRCLREHVFKINPSLLFDLQKYHADAWETFQKFKKEFLMNQITTNISRGISEGYYRDSLDPKIMAIIRIETVQFAFDDRVFPRSEFDFQEVQMQMMDHFTQGLLSEKGRNLYQQYQQSETITTN
ncbi:MAG: TetR/AcrR family transcriptional regulator [Cyclobacteriaceae bacterium]